MAVYLPKAVLAGSCSLLIWTTPSHARFLQTDPIGYQDQFNLYAYVRNDPMNHFDPSGTDAIVIVRENGNVDIMLPMTFSGNAATPQNVAAFIQNIQSTWTGSFGGTNVTMTVVQGTSALDPTVQNTMVITSGNTSNVDPTGGHQGHSFVRGNGREGEITMRDLNRTPIAQPDGRQTVGDKGRDTPAHEAGHYVGAVNSATPSLMGPRSSNAVTAADVAAVTRTQTPSGATNTVIRCSEDERC